MDPYVYEGTSILINKFNLKDQETLNNAESLVFYLKSHKPLPSGNFDAAHLKAIHHHFFSDIYEWAGKERTVSIAKGGSLFAFPERVTPMLNKLFAQLKDEQHLTKLFQAEFCNRLSYYFNELNAIHPFREGNGRTQRAFCGLIAQNAGYHLDWKQVAEEEYLSASISGFLEADYQPMKVLFEKMLFPTRKNVMALDETQLPALTNISIEKLSSYVQKQVELTSLIHKKHAIQSTAPQLSKGLTEQVLLLGNEVRELAKELIKFEDIQTLLKKHAARPYLISLNKQGGFTEIHKRFQNKQIQTQDILAVLRFARSQTSKLSQATLSHSLSY